MMNLEVNKELKFLLNKQEKSLKSAVITRFSVQNRLARILKPGAQRRKILTIGFYRFKNY